MSQTTHREQLAELRRERLAIARKGKWDSLDRRGRPLGLVCPLCGAFVLANENVHGRTYREQHMDWHDELGQ